MVASMTTSLLEQETMRRSDCYLNPACGDQRADRRVLKATLARCCDTHDSRQSQGHPARRYRPSRVKRTTASISSGESLPSKAGIWFRPSAMMTA